MATMNVSLPDRMKDWVEGQVQSGKYSNVSDYVRDLIRRDQEFKDKRGLLLQALIAGEKSGRSKHTIDEIWQSLTARRGEDV